MDRARRASMGRRAISRGARPKRASAFEGALRQSKISGCPLRSRRAMRCRRNVSYALALSPRYDAQFRTCEGRLLKGSRGRRPLLRDVARRDSPAFQQSQAAAPAGAGC